MSIRVPPSLSHTPQLRPALPPRMKVLQHNTTTNNPVVACLTQDNDKNDSPCSSAGGLTASSYYDSPCSSAGGLTASSYCRGVDCQQLLHPQGPDQEGPPGPQPEEVERQAPRRQADQGGAPDPGDGVGRHRILRGGPQ